MGDTVRELSRAPMFIRFDSPRRLVCIPFVFAVLVVMMPVVERRALGQDGSGAPAQKAAEAPAKKASDAPAQKAAVAPAKTAADAAAKKASDAPVKEASGARSSDASGTPAKEAGKGTTKAAAADGANPPAKASGKEAPKSEAREAIERRPYRISLHLACDPSARIDVAKRAELLQQWQVLVKRFVGPPWAVTIEPDSGPLANVDVPTVAPEVFAGFTAFDKVWIVRVSRPGPSGLLMVGREYDVPSRRLGALQEHRLDASSDAPRALLEFALELFNPTAEIIGKEAGGALLKVQGAAITPASPYGAVVNKGMVFMPLRLVSLRNGTVQILRIPFTYLQVQSVEGPVARCAIISPMRDPLSNRMSRPNSLAGLGLKPGNTPVKLRFVTKPDMIPAAGYTLTARRVPDGQPHELGTTDRSGRIVLPPGFADGLVILRLLAGNVEPMVELPIMPGESRPDEQPIPFDPKPLTVALESQIDSLRDEVVDLVALRARLESRMKARLDGEDWNGLDTTLKEFAQLTPPTKFGERLAKLKDDAAQEQAKLKIAVLTKTAQAQIADLQATIDRYLDDETYNAYVDALERARAERGAKDKAAAKKAAVAAVKKAAPPAAVPAKTAQAKGAPAATPGGRGPVQKPAAPPPKSAVPF